MCGEGVVVVAGMGDAAAVEGVGDNKGDECVVVGVSVGVGAVATIKHYLLPKLIVPLWKGGLIGLITRHVVNPDVVASGPAPLLPLGG